MTERLYYRDARLLEFDATVVGHAGDAQHVILDRTAFYPTSGGQPHDTGHLDNAQVIDVIDAEEHVVTCLTRLMGWGRSTEQSMPRVVAIISSSTRRNTCFRRSPQIGSAGKR